MPNDPKWRTIARVSGQEISLVQAMYIHLLVSASQNVTRGHIDVTTEDLASAFDVTEDKISSVLSAMQGRVLEGIQISGWDRRQVKREESGDLQGPAMTAAERKRNQRDRDRERKITKTKSADVTRGHDESRNVTPDKDKDKEVKEREREVHEQPVDNFAQKSAIPPDWSPGNEFGARAKSWGHELPGDPGYTTAQLQQFRDYWASDGAVRNQVQWEMAFAESLNRQKSSARKTSIQPEVNTIDEPDSAVPPGFRGSGD
jgi:hypothetical protein